MRKSIADLVSKPSVLIEIAHNAVMVGLAPRRNEMSNQDIELLISGANDLIHLLMEEKTRRDKDQIK